MLYVPHLVAPSMLMDTRCFHRWHWVVNSAEMNSGVRISGSLFSLHPGMHLGVTLLGHMVILYWAVWGMRGFFKGFFVVVLIKLIIIKRVDRDRKSWWIIRNHEIIITSDLYWNITGICPVLFLTSPFHFLLFPFFHHGVTLPTCLISLWRISRPMRLGFQNIFLTLQVVYFIE